MMDLLEVKSQCFIGHFIPWTCPQLQYDEHGFNTMVDRDSESDYFGQNK